MAREFDKSSNQYLKVGSTPLTATPLTMACWFNTPDTDRHVLIDLANSSVNNRYHRLDLRASGVLRVETQNGTTFVSATASDTSSTNTWTHACGVWASSSSRTAYLDGGGKVTNTGSATPTGINSIVIGGKGNETTDRMEGDIAEVGIWNVVLTDDEIAQLAKGFSPLMIRPESLVVYCPLIRNDDNDLIGGYDMTAYNTPTISPHPPKTFYPSFKG